MSLRTYTGAMALRPVADGVAPALPLRYPLCIAPIDDTRRIDCALA